MKDSEGPSPQFMVKMVEAGNISRELPDSAPSLDIIYTLSPVLAYIYALNSKPS
jgi:hypothetical protein